MRARKRRGKDRYRYHRNFIRRFNEGRLTVYQQKIANAIMVQSAEIFRKHLSDHLLYTRLNESNGFPVHWDDDATQINAYTEALQVASDP